MSLLHEPRLTRSLAAVALSALFAGCSGGAALPPGIERGSMNVASLSRGPAPTPTPAPASKFLTLVSVASITVPSGTTVSAPCAISITASDPTTDKNYIVSAWGSGTAKYGPASFPLQNAPAPSDVSWSLDGSSSRQGVPNWGAPGWVLFSSKPAITQTHCMDLSITAPPNIARGVYPMAIEFHLGTRPLGAYLVPRDAQTISIDVIVT